MLRFASRLMASLLLTFCLLNNAAAQTFFQDFESVTSFNPDLSTQGVKPLPSSYTFGWASAGFSEIRSDTYVSGIKSIRSGTLTNTNDPRFLLTPVLSVSAASSISFKARYTNTSSNPVLIIRITTPANPAVTIADVATIDYGTGAGQLANTTRTFSFVVPTGLTYPADYRVQFWVRGNGGSNRLSLDDIQVAPAVLPVTLVSFTGQPDAEGSVLLRWQTSHERQNRAFEVERSADLKAWTYLGERTGLGTSEVGGVYTFLDKQPLRLGYYRLRQLDTDGTVSYSKVVAVDRRQLARSTEVLVTPDAQGIQLNLTASEFAFPLTVSLYTLSGQLARQVRFDQPTDQLAVSWGTFGQPIVVLRITDASEWPVCTTRVATPF